MDYVLAKQLKDEGFPLHNDFKEYAFFEAQPGGTTGIANTLVIAPDGGYFVPTLSELIEACGDGYLELHRNATTGIWYALDGATLETEGKTPEESVARLWLALNAKD